MGSSAGRCTSSRRSPFCSGSTASTLGGSGPRGIGPNSCLILASTASVLKSPATTSSALSGA